MPTDNIRIYKFGGASVNSAQGVQNLIDIVGQATGKMVLVVSAMGKTTNALERMLDDYLSGSSECWERLELLEAYHLEIFNALFTNGVNEEGRQALGTILSGIRSFLETKPQGDYNFCYDQLIPFGELLSTQIVYQYAKQQQVRCKWLDVRSLLRSDSNFREGNVDLEESKRLVQNAIHFKDVPMYITQGFIAGTANGFSTTLGREGSDYTAALLANFLDAADVTIWKDVDGVLNADPRIFPNTVKLDRISFKEAIELAYFGAQVIHPKTIKPLQNKDIPLYVRSFVNPEAPGSHILPRVEVGVLPPILVLKPNQALISLTPHDYSFVIEDCLSRIFAIFYKHRVKVNIVQSSAISFTVCVDDEKHFLPGAMAELGTQFSVRYNTNLELLTIRHYTYAAIDELTQGRVVYLKQLTRSTARFVMDQRP